MPVTHRLLSLRIVGGQMLVACLVIAAVSTVRGAENPWRFYVPQPSQSPQVKNSAWVINDIDRFILNELEQYGLVPSPADSKSSLLRRRTT